MKVSLDVFTPVIQNLLCPKFWGTLGSLIFALAAAFHNTDDTLFWGRQSLSKSIWCMIIDAVHILSIG
jgi:hypothetical protein